MDSIPSSIQDTDGRIALPRYFHCFVCGSRNPIGLDITFYYTQGRIETEFTPQAQHAGYQEIVHGGILATLLDECMGWTAITSRAVMCVAAELNVRYLVSAKVGEIIRVSSELVADKKRLVLAKGKITREDGTTLCTGEGKYMTLPPDAQQSVIDYAGWGENFRKVYERIQEMRGKREI